MAPGAQNKPLPGNLSGGQGAFTKAAMRFPNARPRPEPGEAARAPVAIWALARGYSEGCFFVRPGACLCVNRHRSAPMPAVPASGLPLAGGPAYPRPGEEVYTDFGV